LPIHSVTLELKHPPATEKPYSS